MATSERDEGWTGIRSVTPLSDERPNQEMNLIGWGIFLVLLIVMLPFGLFLIPLWILWRVYRD